jgi:hypothetical protein
MDLLHKKVQYLDAEVQVNAENISASDSKDAMRRELPLFTQMLKNTPTRVDHSGRPVKDINALQFTANDAYVTNQLISKEEESMKLSVNTIEQGGIIDIMRSLKNMLRVVMAKSQ